VTSYNCLTAGTECGYPYLVDVDIAENPTRSSVNNHTGNILVQQWQKEPPTSVPGQVGPTIPDPFRTLGVEMTATSAMLFHHCMLALYCSSCHDKPQDIDVFKSIPIGFSSERQ
jgi:hypothetical protein